MSDYLRHIQQLQRQSVSAGIPSYCTSSPQVLRAILGRAARTGSHVLVEATANQVNQFGGYTGQTPAGYRDLVYGLADEAGLPREALILGGDHLGPLIWAALPEREAMDRAAVLVGLFVAAGYTKIHLDTSMRLGDDDPGAPLPDETVARRGVALYAACMEAYEALLRTSPGAERPVFIIGSEVPIPGGAQAEEDMAVTRPEALGRTLDAYRAAFLAQGFPGGMEDVIAVVVQPGVEFGDSAVCLYDRVKAAGLSRAAREAAHMMLEGHSTDYQPGGALREMVEDGVGILKVGPELTFALREAVFALSEIEQVLFPPEQRSDVPAVLEQVMQEAPSNWEKHYHGSPDQQRIARKFSLSDRCRYYMGDPRVTAAIERLFANLDGVKLPLGLLHQYLPGPCEAVIAGRLSPAASALAQAHILAVVARYELAAAPHPNR